MKKIIFIIISVALATSIFGYAIYYKLLTRQHYNNDFVNGNTAGNLYNNGLFCEDETMIYFANPNDSNRLYSMKKDGSDVKKINDDSVAFLNVDDHYLYYVRSGGGNESNFSFLNVNTHSLCRIRKDGKGDVFILDDAPSLYASLVGNDIFYLHYDKKNATTLYRVKIDGKEKQQISTFPYYTCSTDGQYIYYNGIERDHNIYKYDTVSNTQSLLFEDNCYMPVVMGNTVYYMDCNHNYQLVKADLSTNEKTILCEDRIDCFHVYGNVIFFQRNGENAAFCSIRTDGSEYTVLNNGNYTSINIVNDNVYYKDFSTGIMYRYDILRNYSSVFMP